MRFQAGGGAHLLRIMGAALEEVLSSVRGASSQEYVAATAEVSREGEIKRRGDEEGERERYIYREREGARARARAKARERERGQPGVRHGHRRSLTT